MDNKWSSFGISRGKIEGADRVKKIQAHKEMWANARSVEEKVKLIEKFGLPDILYYNNIHPSDEVLVSYINRIKEIDSIFSTIDILASYRRGRYNPSSLVKGALMRKGGIEAFRDLSSTFELTLEDARLALELFGEEEVDHILFTSKKNKHLLDKLGMN